jgi:hypothetical protein
MERWPSQEVVAMTAFSSLGAEPRWVAWRAEKRGKAGRLTKIPYSPSGKKARADDSQTWGSRSEAERAAAKLLNGTDNGGIGIELGDLGADVYLAGVDLDSCIDDCGCLAPWAENLLVALPTYAEISPSGVGVKAFFYVAAEHVRPFLGLIGITEPDQWGAKRSVGQNGADHGPGVEIYFSHRYFAVTEHLFAGKPDRIAMLDWPALGQLARLIPNARMMGSSSASGGRDASRSAKAFREGARLRREGKTFEQMCEALCSHADPDIAAWTREKGEAAGMRELHRIWERAAPPASEGAGVSLDDFHAYMPMHTYIYAPTREMWPAGSVNARISPIGDLRASQWLDQNNPVEQMTWCPGLPMIIPNKLVSQGGWIDRKDVRCFNLYRPPDILPGDPTRATKWLDHVNRVFPDNAGHIVKWLAHRVQQPQEKINHALVLGGLQGIGKDTILEPVKHAIGPWNFQEVSAEQVMGRFNSFLKSVILRISEARDLGNVDRYKLYEHMKAISAAPPDVLRCDEKHIREHAVFNVCGVIITTNHKTNGIYLPADDRRHYVSWSDLNKEQFPDTYWQDIYAWYDRDGMPNVAAYLAELDLSDFNPKAPPAQTPAFWQIVDASRAPEDSEMADVLDQLRNPAAVTLQQITRMAPEGFAEFLRDRKNSRLVPHRLEECGDVAVRNNGAKDGFWVVNGKRQVVYAKAELSTKDRYSAATAMAQADR